MKIERPQRTVSGIKVSGAVSTSSFYIDMCKKYNMKKISDSNDFTFEVSGVKLDIGEKYSIVGDRGFMFQKREKNVIFVHPHSLYNNIQDNFKYCMDLFKLEKVPEYENKRILWDSTRFVTCLQDLLSKYKGNLPQELKNISTTMKYRFMNSTSLIFARNENYLKVPTELALYFVDFFSHNHQTQCDNQKYFLTADTIYPINILCDFYVVLSLCDDKSFTKIYFSSFPHLSQESCKILIEIGLKFIEKPCLKCRFTFINPDSKAFLLSRMKDEKMRENGFCSIILEETPSNDKKMKSTSILIALIDPLKNKQSEFKQFCSGIFDEISLFKCSRCKLVVSKSISQGCRYLKHPGERIPFPNSSEMERFIVNPNLTKKERSEMEHKDTLVKSVHFSCCGVQDETSTRYLGCISTIEQHEKGESFSRFEIIE